MAELLRRRRARVERATHRPVHGETAARAVPRRRRVVVHVRREPAGPAQVTQIPGAVRAVPRERHQERETTRSASPRLPRPDRALRSDGRGSTATRRSRRGWRRAVPRATGGASGASSRRRGRSDPGNQTRPNRKTEGENDRAVPRSATTLSRTVAARARRFLPPVVSDGRPDQASRWRPRSTSQPSMRTAGMATSTITKTTVPGHSAHGNRSVGSASRRDHENAAPVGLALERDRDLRGQCGVPVLAHLLRQVRCVGKDCRVCPGHPITPTRRRFVGIHVEVRPGRVAGRNRRRDRRRAPASRRRVRRSPRTR